MKYFGNTKNGNPSMGDEWINAIRGRVGGINDTNGTHEFRKS